MIEYGWPDFVGNIGVALIISAFFGLQTGRMHPQQMTYILLNLFGPLLILVSLYFHFNLSSFIIECVWLAISLYGLARRLLN